MEFMDSRAAYSGNNGNFTCSHPMVNPIFHLLYWMFSILKRKEFFFGVCYAVLGEAEILCIYVI